MNTNYCMRQESGYVYSLITINSDLTPGATPARKTERKGRNEDTLSWKLCVVYRRANAVIDKKAPFPHSRFSASIKHQNWNKHLPSNKHLPLPAKHSENLLTGYSKFITGP